MMEKRVLKREGNTFILTIDRYDGKIVTVVKSTLDEMKDNLKGVQTNKHQAMARKYQLEDQIKKLEVTDTPRLRELMDEIKKCQMLDQKEKLEFELKNILVEFDRLDKQEEEILKAIPELTRGKKK